MQYKIKQETKPTLTTFGKYKAVASHQLTIDTKQIMDEVCENNPLSPDVINSVLIKLSEVIKRHLRNGDRVRLDEFGLMKLEIVSDKVDKPKDFKPKKHIKGVRLHFLPESNDGKQELYHNIKFVLEKY